jgi:hypothetical protein
MWGYQLSAISYQEQGWSALARRLMGLPAFWSPAMAYKI